MIIEIDLSDLIKAGIVEEISWDSLDNLAGTCYDTRVCNDNGCNSKEFV